MHPNEIDFRDNEDTQVAYRVIAGLKGKKYQEALMDQFGRQGLLERKTKLDS
jgi:hypothetical protein